MSQPDALGEELSLLMRDLQDRKGHSEWLIKHWPTVVHALVSETPAIPKGWKIVPVNPDEPMLLAARDWSLAKYGKAVGNDGATGCYKVMLSAAPSPTGNEEK